CAATLTYYHSPPPRPLLSFPTRRSSDLATVVQVDIDGAQIGRRTPVEVPLVGGVAETVRALLPRLRTHKKRRHLDESMKHYTKRSEEHTSELQSRFDLVCRLLLEKKKKE